MEGGGYKCAGVHVQGATYIDEDRGESGGVNVV